jgi:hypothetical protein
MSGNRRSPNRLLSKISVHVSCTGLPALYSARGETTRPSSYRFCLFVEKPPGTDPPMSRWCAFSVTKAMISPPLKTGRMNSRSLTCVPVRYGSLAMMTSPGSSLPTPYSSMVMRTDSVIVPVNRMIEFDTAGVG